MSGLDIKILLSSDPDYEELTAEIFCQGKFVALLNKDAGPNNMKIEFPGSNVREDTVLREVDLVTFEKALTEAKQKIKGE